MDHQPYCTCITLIYFIYILQKSIHCHPLVDSCHPLVVSSTSLCTENTNFIQALESVKNVIKDRHSRPCVSCSKSALLILKTLDHDALTCSMSVAEVNKLICKAWRCWEHHCFIFADHFSKLLLCLNISNLKYQFNIKYLIIICFIQSVSIRHGPHLCRITSPCLQFGLLCPGL